ncbi:MULTISPECIES: gas vesicle protein [unclassified Kitasatospora]|uniref:gas vesicle protein n=1 Tax=unclassified Kitasatospora TaxID=2633591 RepID=UPI00340E1262
MTTGSRPPTARPGLPPTVPERNVALVDLLDRLLAGGVVIAGEITLSIADVDLVRISLRAMIASVRAATQATDQEPT